MALAILVIANATVWAQRDAIADWWRLRNYQAPASVVALASDDTMTDYAKRLLYVNRPSLENKQDFNANCVSKAEQTAVLGCYHGNRQGIFIYDVVDPRLAGVQQVTAAHEMLHQAYDRLSSSERKHINVLLEDFYAHGLTDQTVKDKVESYRQQKGAVLVNEMHSIFGTEVSNLPPELETYYKRYFIDRAKIVSYRNAYQSEFTRRETLVAQYDARLTSLKKQIDANKASLEAKKNYLNAKQAVIDQAASAHDQAAYNTAVIDYNNTVVAYNDLVAATKSLINQYNNIVAERNDIALQEQQLQEALDSRLTTPAPKQ